MSAVLAKMRSQEPQSAQIDQLDRAPGARAALCTMMAHQPGSRPLGAPSARPASCSNVGAVETHAVSAVAAASTSGMPGGRRLGGDAAKGARALAGERRVFCAAAAETNFAKLRTTGIHKSPLQVRGRSMESTGRAHAAQRGTPISANKWMLRPNFDTCRGGTGNNPQTPFTQTLHCPLNVTRKRSFRHLGQSQI